MRKIATAVLLVALGAVAWAQLSPVPALPDAERRTSYSASGIGPYSVGFALYGDGTDYQNWIQVYVSGVPTTGYTLDSPSGPVGSIARPITDARITFANAPTGTIQIIGARRPRRTSQLSENRGVSARDFNVIITDLVAQFRELWDKTQNRVVQIPPGETMPVLPPAASRASQNAIFDSAGNLTAGLPASGGANVSVAMQPVVSAATIPAAASLLGVTAVPVGTVMPFAGFTAPTSFDFAAGQAYSRVNFPQLLAAITSSQTGTCTNGSGLITGLLDTSQFGTGQRIEGSRIPSLTNTISVINSATSLTTAQVASSSGSCTVQVFPYGNGDGLTTFNLPDLRGRDVAGRDTMAGPAAGRLTSTYFGAIAALGVTGGSESHTLTVPELPSHTHANSLTDPGHSHTVPIGNLITGAGTNNAALVGGPSTATTTNTTGITITNAAAGGGAAHAIVDPKIQLNYIVRVVP